MKTIEFFKVRKGDKFSLPLFAMSVSAGLPIPAGSDIDQVVDLNEFLVEHPAATYFARVYGNSMKDVGIADGDILIVDKAVMPRDGRIVVVKYENDIMVRYFREKDGVPYIESQDGKFLPIGISKEIKMEVKGVVTKIIHSFS